MVQPTMVRHIFALLIFCIWKISAEEKSHQGEWFDITNELDLIWCVQISDIHFSSYVRARDEDFESYLPLILKNINPALVIITGDLTDAKNKYRTVTRQDESEWKRYSQVIKNISRLSGIPLNRFADLRGNHDTFEVPFRGQYLDFFSRLSVSGALNRSSTVQSFMFKNSSGHPQYQFVTLDTSPRVGLRGPNNFFGHPTDADLDLLDSALHQSSGATWHPKVVLGHYPLVFVAPSETKRRVQDILSRNAVLGYLPGHLHYKFGTRMFRKHEASGPGNPFWELGAGDWKDNRMMRVFAIDSGHLSFSDWPVVSSQPQPFLLVTHPPDARFLLDASVPAQPEIRALVFGAPPGSIVSAKVYRSLGDSLNPDRVPFSTIHLKSTLVNSGQSNSPVLYRASFDPTQLPNQPLLWLVVSLSLPGSPSHILSPPQPFSLHKGSPPAAPLSQSLIEYSVLHYDWPLLWPWLLSLPLALLWSLLLLPSGLSLVGIRGDLLGDRWGPETAYMPVSVTENAEVAFPVQETSSDSAHVKRHVVVPWVPFALSLVQNCSSSVLGVLNILALAAVCLGLPLFWGQPLGEGQALGTLSLYGWLWWDQSVPPGTRYGVPDVATSIFPLLALCWVPLAAWSLLWSTERSLRSAVQVQCGVETLEGTQLGTYGRDEAEAVGTGDRAGGNLVRRRSYSESMGGTVVTKERVGGVPSRLDGVGYLEGWCQGLRVAVWVLGAMVVYLHYWQLGALCSAYGGLVLLAPGYGWLCVYTLLHVWSCGWNRQIIM